MRRGNDHAARPGAFTAIETLAVVALMALLASVVSLSLAGMGRSSDMESAVGRIRSFDRLTREQARRIGRPMALTFDLDDATVGRSELSAGLDPNRRDRAPSSDGGPGLNQKYGGAALALGAGFSIDRVTTARGAATAGTVVVPVSTAGWSPTYALAVSGPGRRRWVVFSGVGCDMREMTDDRDVDEIFARLRRK